MQIQPTLDAFTSVWADAQPQVVYTRLVADLETPVSAMLKITGDRTNTFLLESVEGGAVRGRYSMIGLDPDLLFRANGDVAELKLDPSNPSSVFEPSTLPTLQALRQLIDESKIDMPEDVPPMAAGVFGQLGYDIIRQIEHLPSPNPRVLDVPDCLLMRPRTIVIFDAVKDEITVVTAARPNDNETAEQAYNKAINRIQATVDLLDQPLQTINQDVSTLPDLSVRSNMTPEEYKSMVLRAKEFVKAGDIFQVVLSQRFEADFALPPFSLYRALRRTNPSPFLFYLNFEDYAIAGSSPEILVRVRDGKVTIRPIAGTRPRGETPARDRELAADLLADEKERAEHLMLLDLGRNDVGRVSEIGSVTVTDKFFVEYYSHVMHIVSNVEGDLSAEYDALDALAGGFPAGTVSGAPKVRAMEIIDELESERRGAYAGCVGYFSADGNMDTCIVLRTAIIKDGKMYVQAGAGIVADSDPESEHLECVNKAKALFRAADEAVRFASLPGKGQ